MMMMRREEEEEAAAAAAETLTEQQNSRGEKDAFPSACTASERVAAFSIIHCTSEK